MIWTLIVCTIFLFVGKTATPFINSAINRYFFGIKVRKNKHEAFDQLVEYKKSQMRGSTTAQQGSSQQRQKVKNAFQRRVENHFDKLSQSGKKKELAETKKLLTLFDNLNWGTGPEIKQLAQLMSAKIKFTINENQTGKILNTALKDGHLQKIPQSAPLTLETVADCLRSLALINLLHESPPFQKKILGEICSNKILNQSIALFHFSQRNNINISLEKILSSSFTKLSDAQLKALTLNYDMNEFISELKLNIKLLSGLEPLTKDHKLSDQNNALNIFGLKRLPDLNTLKKAYKKLVLERHPDALSSRGLNEVYLRQINENFTNIQWAYDILVNDLNN